MKHVLFPYVHVMGRHEVTYKICHKPKRKKKCLWKNCIKIGNSLLVFTSNLVLIIFVKDEEIHHLRGLYILKKLKYFVKCNKVS